MTGTAGALTWHHTSLVVDDIDQAVASLRGQFGFEVALEERAMAEPIRRMLGLAEVTCDLIQGFSPVSPHVLELIEFRDIPADADVRLPIWPGMSHLAYVVADLAVAVRSLTSSGGSQIGEVTEFEEGPAVYCRTPGGIVVEFEQWHEPPAVRPRL